MTKRFLPKERTKEEYIKAYIWAESIPGMNEEVAKTAGFKDFAEMREYASKAHFMLEYELVKINGAVVGGLKYSHLAFPDQPLVRGAEVDKIIDIYATYPDGLVALANKHY